MQVRPKTTAAAPFQSIDFEFGSLLSAANSTASVTETTASGTFSRKIARQDTWSTSQPPRTGPVAAVNAPKPAQRPIALLRSLSANAAPNIARLAGVNSAAPR